MFFVISEHDCSPSLTIYLTTLKQEEVMIDIYRGFMLVSGTYNLETTARTLVPIFN